jgi:hypothetical protein
MAFDRDPGAGLRVHHREQRSLALGGFEIGFVEVEQTSPRSILISCGDLGLSSARPQPRFLPAAAFPRPARRACDHDVRRLIRQTRLRCYAVGRS